MLVLNVPTIRFMGCKPARPGYHWAWWGRHGVRASQCHDDALGRVLADLAEYGSKIVATVELRMQGIQRTPH